MPTAKRYKVINPGDIPKGIPLLQWQAFTWYEGDVFEVPNGMSIENLLRKGCVIEVKDG